MRGISHSPCIILPNAYELTETGSGMVDNDRSKRRKRTWAIQRRTVREAHPMDTRRVGYTIERKTGCVRPNDSRGVAVKVVPRRCGMAQSQQGE